MQKKPAKKEKEIKIEAYSHAGKKRTNNPPVGLVSSQTDKLNGYTKYAHDPYIDPYLSWAEKKASLEATLKKKQNEYKELVLMKARGMISDEDFVDLKATQKAEIGSLERALGNRGQVDSVKKKEIHRAFKLALGIEEIFKNGLPVEKKELLSETQSNLTIKGKKLNVYNTGTYGKIINGLLLARAENPSFEPRKYGSNKGQNEAFTSVCPTLLRG